MNPEACAATELRILQRSIGSSFRLHEGYRDIPGSVNARLSMVSPASTAYHINTLSILPPSTSAGPKGLAVGTYSNLALSMCTRLTFRAAVFLHGFGAGLALWSPTLPFITEFVQEEGVPCYAFDWLGMGRSSRLQHTVQAPKTDTKARVLEAEDFFLDSFEAWRAELGLERMVIVGHSLGGYLGVAYALRKPERVVKIVLLSPAGVHSPPSLPTPSTTSSPSSSPSSSFALISPLGTDRRPHSMAMVDQLSMEVASVLSFSDDSSMSVVSVDEMEYPPPSASSPKKLRKKWKPGKEAKIKEPSKPKIDFVRIVVSPRVVFLNFRIYEANNLLSYSSKLSGQKRSTPSDYLEAQHSSLQ